MDAITHGPLLWFLNRGTGVAVLLLLTAATALGILAARPARSRRVPGFVTQQLHRNLAVLGVVLVALHALTATVDTFVDIRWWQALWPFGATYDPVWLGLGTFAFDLMLLLALTSAVRRHMNPARWRTLHRAGYLAWPVAVAHSVGIGTDASAPWAVPLGVGCVAVIVAAGLSRGWAHLKAARRARSLR